MDVMHCIYQEVSDSMLDIHFVMSARDAVFFVNMK